MKKLSLFLLCFSFGAAGCTNGYRVYVNGFSELKQPIRQNTSFYVSAPDPNSRNPIFDSQVKSKIEALLRLHNYTPVEDVNNADYVITFNIGAKSHHYLDYEPFYRPYFFGGYYGGYWSGYEFGYTTYIPYYDTYYDKWLTMKVMSRGKEDSSKTGNVVWVGEAVVSTGNDDMRKIIDYLLVGCFDYFGQDTLRQKSIVVTEDEPEILNIQSIR
jgi:hypothetical protein